MTEILFPAHPKDQLPLRRQQLDRLLQLNFIFLDQHRLIGWRTAGEFDLLPDNIPDLWIPRSPPKKIHRMIERDPEQKGVETFHSPQHLPLLPDLEENIDHHFLRRL